MPNNPSIFYLKGSGEDWASSKCSIDDCYSIPYSPEVEMYLQADIPDPYWASEVWLCDMAGTRLQNIIPLTEWKIIYDEPLRRFIFKMPSDSYACNNIPTEGCFVDILDDNVFTNNGISDWYDGSAPGTTVTIYYLGVPYPLGAPNSSPALPTGWAWIDGHTISLPCGIPYPSLAQYQVTYDTTPPSGVSGSFGNNVQEGDVPSPTTLDCFYLEIPLYEGSDEVATLCSEPFECINPCMNYVEISSDYCRSETDIFGGFIFDTTDYGGTQYGWLTEAKNNMLIQAVLKTMPSRRSDVRNLKCNNFKSTIEQQYKLQGAMPIDFPPYMAHIIESICGGKTVFINGDEYIPTADQIFTERGVDGRSMWKLDVTLKKCQHTVVFDCSCIEPPVNCEVNPVVYDGVMLVVNLPFTPYGETNNILDDTYVWTEIDPMAISGGTPPYAISNWHTNAGQIAPNNDFEVFDDTRYYNIWRRINTPDKMQALTESVLVDITDANGCKITTGVTVTNVFVDMRCVGFGGSITIGTVTNNSIQITQILSEFGVNTFTCFDISIDALTSGYQITGVLSLPYTITGLSAGTEYQIVVRIWCGCPADPNAPVGETSGQIGPIRITTLP